MNYSIIFTEISFFPETEISVTNNPNNSYNIMDYARFDREGRSLSVLAPRWQTTTRLPLTRPRLARAPLGTSGPPLFWEKGGDSKFPKTQSKEKTSTNRI